MSRLTTRTVATIPELAAAVAFLVALCKAYGRWSVARGEAFLAALYERAPVTASRTEWVAVRLDALTPATPADQRGQLGLGTILAAFVVVIAAMVVLIVVDQMDQTVGTPSSSSLSTAKGDILSGFGSMNSLIEPLLLIAIGVVIIGLIRRVQGS